MLYTGKQVHIFVYLPFSGMQVGTVITLEVKTGLGWVFMGLTEEFSGMEKHGD